MFTLRDLFRPRRRVAAHCDLPCGIYDPDQARIEAESCLRIIEKYHESKEDEFRDRCLIIKEARVELITHHLDELWRGYFKPEHVEQFPSLHRIFWEAGKQAGKVRETTNRDEAVKLLDMIDRIEEMWVATGGAEKTRIGRSAALRN